MLFSAQFKNYRCSRCSAEWSNVIPTSILPTLATWAFAGVFWAQTLENIIAVNLLIRASGFIIAPLSFWGAHYVVTRATNRAIRKGQCPTCHGQLAQFGSGFYDGGVPAPWELLTYAATIAVAVLAWLISRFASSTS